MNRGGAQMGFEKPTTKHAAARRRGDLYWAAGFLEGEGFFGRTTPTRTGGSTERVTARQLEQEPLEQLARMFGGRVAFVRHRANRLSNKPGIYDWGVHGARARGVMMTLYAFLSSRRRAQVRSALGCGG